MLSCESLLSVVFVYVSQLEICNVSHCGGTIPPDFHAGQLAVEAGVGEWWWWGTASVEFSPCLCTPHSSDSRTLLSTWLLHVKKQILKGNPEVRSLLSSQAHLLQG